MKGKTAPAKSTFCGVAQRGVKTSGITASAIGRKLKMPPPPLLIKTTVKGGCMSPAYIIVHMGLAIVHWPWPWAWDGPARIADEEQSDQETLTQSKMPHSIVPFQIEQQTCSVWQCLL